MIYKSDSPQKFLKYENAGVIIVPVPYEKTTSYGHGTKSGPSAICEASSQVELFDEELGIEPYHIGIYTHKSVETLPQLEDVITKIINDGGGQKCPDARRQQTREEAYLNGTLTKRVRLATTQMGIFHRPHDKKIPIVLGGEHTISAAAIRACKSKYENLSVVHFDAHADLRDTLEGSKLSHACVLRRVHEAQVPFVQIGIRSHSIEEAEFIKKAGLKRPFYAFEICRSNNDDWMDKALEGLTKDVYLTFDVDAFDPSIIPSTGTPEPGGMTWYQVITFFRKLSRLHNIVGADFVELAPTAGDSSSDFTIAKLIYKFIGYLQKK